MNYRNKKTISKYWGKCYLDEPHWAHYVFEDEAEQDYWLAEHIDEANKRYWRHYEFMSIPCEVCGAYSPLRASSIFYGGILGGACAKREVRDHHPDEVLPNNIAYYRENGWTYIFFKETLSDSLDGQETFRLASRPDGNSDDT